MPPDPANLLLLGDAIDRVLANPTAGHCWRNLMAVMRAGTRPGTLQETVRILAASVPPRDLPGFYLASFLDMATGDSRHVAQAVACLRQIAPRDLDRQIAFLHVGWQRALLQAGDRVTFERRLREGDLPALAALIGDGARERLRDRPFPPPRTGAVRRIDKVAIVAPVLTRPQHPPTLMALNQAEVLLGQGVAVRLFSCQEACVPDADALLGTGIDIPVEAVQLAPWCRDTGGGVQIHAADPRFSVLRRYRDMLPAIDAFAPDVVLFVGLHSGLVATLHARYPVLGLGTNSVAPMVPADVWLTAHAGSDGAVARPWNGAFPESQAWHHPYRVWRKPLRGTRSRDGLGIAGGSVVLVSVGNRLEWLIHGEWAARMRTLMCDHPRLVWLLVGGEGAVPPALNGLPRERLRPLAHVPDAWEITAIADVYVHPPMMGGGFAVAEAMSFGVPAVALAESDGGDKVAARAVGGIDAYFERLEALIADADLRRSEGAAMRAHFDTVLDLGHSGPGLVNACARALERHARRTQNAQA